MRSRVDVLGEVHETVSHVANVKVGPLADCAVRAARPDGAVVSESQASRGEMKGGPMGILIGIVCNAIALYLTTFVPGITFNGNLVTLLVAGRSWACST